MSRAKSVQFNPKQYLGDNKVLGMEWDARGMHFHLLMISTQEMPPGTLPSDDAAIRRWLSLPPGSVDADQTWRRVKPQLLAAWQTVGDRLVNSGMVETFERKDNFGNRPQNRVGTTAVPQVVHKQESRDIHPVISNDLLKETTTFTELVYSVYPRKVGRSKAIEEIKKAIARLLKGEALIPFKTMGEAAAWLHDRTESFANSPSGQKGEFTPHPSTWYHQSRYTDNEAEWYAEGKSEPSKKQQRTASNQRLLASEILGVDVGENVGLSPKTDELRSGLRRGPNLVQGILPGKPSGD